MLCLGKSTLLFLAAVLFLIGTILVCRSFRRNSKEVLGGAVGVIILLFSGNIVIYLYSQLPVPKRVIEEFHSEELPDLGMNFEEQNSLTPQYNKGLVKIE